MSLENKVALITGASSGIGKAISLKLSKEGARVALLDKNDPKKIENEIKEAGGNAYSLIANLRRSKEVRQAINRTIKHYKGLDILINNAGLGIFKEAEKLSIKEWDEQLNVMLRGAYLTTKLVLPHMYKKEDGHIVVISSLWAKQGSALCTAYTAAKYGLRGYTDSLREEARKHNVKVTNIMPGTVDTHFFDKTDWEHDFSKTLQPEDVANFVADILKYSGNVVVEEAVLRSIHPDIGGIYSRKISRPDPEDKK